MFYIRVWRIIDNQQIDNLQIVKLITTQLLTTWPIFRQIDDNRQIGNLTFSKID